MNSEKIYEEVKYNSGNKLPYYYDDPIDIFLKKICDILNPYFFNIGITPNIITTLSFLFGLLSCFLYYKNLYILSSISFLISYYFDVMDGYFARIYNMRSKFGSYYDFITDTLIGLLFFYLIIINKKIIKLKLINIKFLIIFIFITLYLLSVYHFSCQEKYTKNTNKINVSEGLFMLKYINCNDVSIMKYTRYFGTGFLSIFFVFVIFLHIFFTKK